MWWAGSIPPQESRLRLIPMWLSVVRARIVRRRVCSDCYFGLEWIQREIESFGGDRKKVTLMGHSAGGSQIQEVSLSIEHNTYKLFGWWSLLVQKDFTIDSSVWVDSDMEATDHQVRCPKFFVFENCLFSCQFQALTKVGPETGLCQEERKVFFGCDHWKGLSY